jgi:hypothetical protein
MFAPALLDGGVAVANASYLHNAASNVVVAPPRFRQGYVSPYACLDDTSDLTLQDRILACA